MQLVKIFTKFSCKDDKKINPILTSCKKFHIFFTYDKKTITIFANMLKTLHYFWHHAKNFIIFLANLLKIKENLAKKEKFIEFFALKKNL